MSNKMCACERGRADAGGDALQRSQNKTTSPRIGRDPQPSSRPCRRIARKCGDRTHERRLVIIHHKSERPARRKADCERAPGTKRGRTRERRAMSRAWPSYFESAALLTLTLTR
jgi:hypothetical protein